MIVDLSERRDLRGLALRLFALAWPVALARLGIMGMGLCDAIVVGRLAPQDLSYQALGWAPTGVMLVSGVGLLTGVQVLAARALGAELPHQAGAALQRGVVVALIGGVLAVLGVNLIGESVYSAFGVAPELVAPSTRIMRVLMLSVPLHLIYIACAMFVEAIAQPLVSTWVMGIANVLNLAVNLWLVPRLGALGSAWATVAARGFLALAMLLWLARLPEAGRLGLALRWRSGGLTTHGYREFFAVGVAAAVSQAAESGAFGGMTILAGRLGGQAVAGYQIALSLLSVVFMCSLGMASATAVLAARELGRRDGQNAALRVSWVGLVCTTGVMLCIAVLLLLWPRPIAQAYTVAQDIATVVVILMPLVASAVIVDGGQVVASAALRALSDNWFPTASHLLAYALVMPGVAFFLAEIHGFGVRGLLLAVNVASVLSVGVLMLRLWALTRRAPAQQAQANPHETS